ncbi:MAG TPA: hypothetical protein GYA07_05190 [Verrucomicrobia bacterium]|nr:hypothetical protein [Verrucomicrobiota bacterium]
MSIEHARTNLAGNLTISGLVNFNSHDRVETAKLTFVGDVSNTYTVALPNSIRTTDGQRTYWVTNGTIGRLTIETEPVGGGVVITNATYAPLW